MSTPSESASRPKINLEDKGPDAKRQAKLNVELVKEKGAAVASVVRDFKETMQKHEEVKPEDLT